MPNRSLLACSFASFVCVGACAAHEDPPVDSSHQAVGSLQAVASFGSNPAQLEMFAYVPADMPPTPRPLVVAMHGCQQTASQYTIAGWHHMADLWKFYVVYPQQNTAVNNSLGCFNWGGSWDGAPSTFVFNAPLHLEDLQRGHSENQSIIEMVDYMKDTYAIDDGRVFATGLSAGGGMTSVMLATWPDVFAGGAIVAGVPYGCVVVPNATTQQGGDCIKAHPEGHQLNRTASQWGDLVRAAYPGYAGPYPKVAIWQGTSDFVVAPELATELLEQWTNVHGIDMTADATEQIGSAAYSAYRDGTGQTLVETFVIGGMSHGQPVDAAGGCGEAGLYFNDVSLCAAQRAVAYFGLDGSGGDDGGDGGDDGGDGGDDGGDGGDDGGDDGGGDGSGADDEVGQGGFQCAIDSAARSNGGGAGALAVLLGVAVVLLGRRRGARGSDEG